MACVPGMPCFGPVKGPVYPEGMGPCEMPCIDAQYVIYEGANLPCSGVNNNTNLQLALQQIDEKICPEAMLRQIITVLQVNPELKALFCLLVNECIPTTTTTTTLI